MPARSRDVRGVGVSGSNCTYCCTCAQESENYSYVPVFCAERRVLIIREESLN